jgi:hypothetical protein
MVYYTQLIYLNEGKEAIFLDFENHVLPILAKYEGLLLYRVRPDVSSVVESNIDLPYEVHLVSFPSKEMFTAYAGDEERQQYLGMKNEPVARVVLIEGYSL